MWFIDQDTYEPIEVPEGINNLAEWEDFGFLAAIQKIIVETNKTEVNSKCNERRNNREIN